ncbi:hypothetical protein EVAR_52314_1 [Eumeta japonica]|uniref:Uncharacterized protein n=1 Tax=Eumeta variegata TaxID=151549 RepID=A0A4C1Y776_EUMVA|nr:hypothetical protein EVAR_52314_1 [Eumeta japonica]
MQPQIAHLCVISIVNSKYIYSTYLVQKKHRGGAVVLETTVAAEREDNITQKSETPGMCCANGKHNALVQLFKIALDRIPSDNHKIVIRADRTPFGEHARQFNAPTIDEVAIVILDDQFQSRDIVLHRRNDQLQRVSELHRSYDALQYPILHWKGDDGYHINIPKIDARTAEIPDQTVDPEYVNKGSDIAVFGVAGDNRNDEITQYQMGRYISSNEAFWRIMSFPMHERHPVVVHLAVRLENGQRLYFNEANVLERAAHPPATTLTVFFNYAKLIHLR